MVDTYWGYIGSEKNFMKAYLCADVLKLGCYVGYLVQN